VVELVPPVVIIDDCCALVEVAVLGGELLSVVRIVELELTGVVEAKIEDVELIPIVVLLGSVADIVEDGEVTGVVLLEEVVVGEVTGVVVLEEVVVGEVTDMVELNEPSVDVTIVTVGVLPVMVTGSVIGEVDGFVVNGVTLPVVLVIGSVTGG